MSIWVGIGGLIGLIVIVVWAITIIHIVGQHMPRGKTAAWLLIVILLPLVGSILYWALYQPPPEDVQYQADAERALRESAHSAPFDGTGIR